MTITAPVAPVRVTASLTELVRADEVRVGDVITQHRVSVTMQLDAETVAIVLDTPSGPCIDEVRPDQMVRIRRRENESTHEEACTTCATTPCVFCRANELLNGYGITDYSITRSL